MRGCRGRNRWLWRRTKRITLLWYSSLLLLSKPGMCFSLVFEMCLFLASKWPSVPLAASRHCANLETSMPQSNLHWTRRGQHGNAYRWRCARVLSTYEVRNFANSACGQPLCLHMCILLMGTSQHTHLLVLLAYCMVQLSQSMWIQRELISQRNHRTTDLLTLGFKLSLRQSIPRIFFHRFRFNSQLRHTRYSSMSIQVEARTGGGRVDSCDHTTYSGSRGG